MQVPRQLEAWLQRYNSLYDVTNKTLNVPHVGVRLHGIEAKKMFSFDLILVTLLALFSDY